MSAPPNLTDDEAALWGLCDGADEAHLNAADVRSLLTAISTARGEAKRMREALQEIADEVNKAHAWHPTTGMKVAKPPRVLPSVVKWLKPILDAALAAEAREGGE